MCVDSFLGVVEVGWWNPLDGLVFVFADGLVFLG